MIDVVRDLLPKVMRVPAEPHAPAGAPGTLRVFRAGKNFFRLKLIGWGISQVFAFAVIVFWVLVFFGLERAAVEARENRSRTATIGTANPPRAGAETATTPVTSTGSTSIAPASNEAAKSNRKKATTPARPRRSTRETFTEWKAGLALAVAQLPGWAFALVWVLKIFGLLAYFAQLPVTYAIARFDYEMRWYLVTDRSLRLRHGIWKLEESTMSFANIQQVVVTQGPLQRLLGLADVQVQSAGGGGGTDSHGSKSSGDTLHTAVFHAVENAEEIRDLILARLQQFRTAGLGDPDDHHAAIGTGAPSAATSAAPSSVHALAAAHELLLETRQLRAVLEG